MMLPAFLLLGVGKMRRPWIPIPLVFFWPFWLLGWVVWLVFGFIGFKWVDKLGLALVLGLRLSGTRVDVDTADGEHVHIRLV